MEKQLESSIATGKFEIDSARKLVEFDWRTWVAGLPADVKKDAEDLFYFVEGFIEETDEGFMSESDDPELCHRVQKLLERLRN